MTNNADAGLLRVIDANLNRLKEGIRVIEDFARYGQDDVARATRLKNLRHRCRIDNLATLLHSRDSVNDVLRPTMPSEMQRKDLGDILTANYKRAQESTRVLEEMYKIVDPQLSETFKKIRYELYTLEKEHLLSFE